MMSIRGIAVAILFCAATGWAQATEIFVDFSNLAGDVWTAEFRLVNTGSLALIGNFTIYFDPLQVSQLQLISAPPIWDTIVIQPDVALASDGFMDALITDPAQSVLPGQVTGLFKMQFDWLSALKPPASLRFGIYDAGFNELESGQTTASGTTPVPEPISWLLFCVGLAVVCAARHRRSVSSARG